MSRYYFFLVFFLPQLVYPKVIAKVGNKTVTEKELTYELKIYSNSPSFQKRLLTLTREGRRKILLDYLKDYLLYLEAEKEGITLDDEEKWRLKRLEISMIVSKFKRSFFQRQHIGIEELRKFYEKNKKLFTIPERRKVRHIVVKDKKTAEKILKLIEKGASVEELASRYNVDETRKNGGYLGWIRKGIMAREFEEAVFKTSKGGISGIVKTPFGYHIIKVEDIKPEEILPFDKVKDRIEKIMLEERLKLLLNKLWKRYKVYIERE